MVLEDFKLQGKVAIVTGCKSGLGQTMAIALAEVGADILGVDYLPTQETQQIIENLGRRYEFIEADLSDVSCASEIVKFAVEKFEKVDILVNNAGIIRREDALDFSEENWDAVMNINLKTVFFLSQAVANQFVKQKSGGKILNIASMLSFQGGIRVPSYTASKSGIKGITMALANEWAKYNINVNAIAPGYMATANTVAIREDAARSAEILSRIPAARWGLPEDLKGPSVFLCSNASDYINGFTIAVDGGWLAR